MAIAFRSAGTQGSAVGVSPPGTHVNITLGAPAGIASADVVLAVFQFVSGTSITITPPAGWTLVVRTDSTTLYGQAVYWALWNVASYVFDVTSSAAAADPIVGYALAYSGVDNTSPIDVQGGQANASSTTVTAPSITTTAANDLLVGFFGWNSGTSVTTFATLFGTERGPSGAATGVGAVASATNFEGVDAADELQAAAGASGAKTATLIAAKQNVGQLVALKAAASSGGGTGPSFNGSAFDGTVFYASVAGTQFTATLAGTLTSSGTLSKLTLRTLLGTLTSAGTLAKLITHTFSGAMASSGALVKRGQKVLDGTMTSSGTLTLLKLVLRSVAGTLTSAGALVKLTAHGLAGTMTSAGALAKQTQKTFAGTMASAGALVKQTIRVLAGTLTSSGTLLSIKAALKSLAGTLTSSGTLLRLPIKACAGAMASSGAIVKRTNKVLAGVLAPIGTLTKQIRRGLSGTLSLIGTFFGAPPSPPVIGAPLTGRQDATALTGRQDNPALTGNQNPDSIKGQPS